MESDVKFCPQQQEHIPLILKSDKHLCNGLHYILSKQNQTRGFDVYFEFFVHPKRALGHWLVVVGRIRHLIPLECSLTDRPTIKSKRRL